MRSLKKSLHALLAATLLLPGATALANSDLVQTDQGGVLHSGSKKPHFDANQGLQLKKGLYDVGDLNSYFWSTEYYLMIDTYVNDPGKYLAILFSTDAMSQHRTTAYLYEGRPVKGGAVVMLSPLVLDLSGNLRVQSEGQTNAPVIEIMARPGDHRYPYVLRGRNGALGGSLLGMRGGHSDEPQLRPTPSGGLFVSGSNSSVDLLVQGTEVSINNGSLADQTFDLISLNGEQGKFAALTHSTLDTMGEVELADERVAHIATFITGCFDREAFLILSPTTRWGEFTLESYQIAEPGLFERLFPGSRDPQY